MSWPERKPRECEDHNDEAVPIAPQATRGSSLLEEPIVMRLRQNIAATSDNESNNGYRWSW